MNTNGYYKRHVEGRLRAMLKDARVVLIEGPRQCGKTTLAKMIRRELGYEYITFDDPADLAVARDNPKGFVERLPERVILDEVQIVPELLSSIKLVVDRERIPGRFILTGSVNLFRIPKLGDSLAGRMETIKLHPLSQCEIEGVEPTFLNRLFADEFGDRRGKQLPPGELEERVTKGGYPEAMLRPDQGRRNEWGTDYVNTIIQRDLPVITNAHSLELMGDLLELAANETAQILSAERLAKSFQLTRPTIQNYMAALQQVFLVHKLRPWFKPTLPRMIKKPKLHLTDTGLLCALRRLNKQSLQEDHNVFGAILESFVLQELRRQASASAEPHDFNYYRTRDDHEVDIVIERGNQVAGVEVKASASFDGDDFRGLRHFKKQLGDRFRAGVVVYNGERAHRLKDGLWAVPAWMLWAAP